MKWTEKDLAKYAMMREVGFTKAQIRREFGEAANRGGSSCTSETTGRGGACSSRNKKRSKNMKEYGKRVQIDPAQFWAMVDAGKTRTEIAKHFGVSVQTVCNRITKGRPSAATPHPSASPTPSPTGEGSGERDSACDEKFEEIINSVDAGSKKENNDMDTKEAIMNTFLGSGRPEAQSRDNENNTYNNETHEYDTEDRVPLDAPSSYAEIFAEAASSIVRSAEFSGINIQYANVTVEGGCTVATVKGFDKSGRSCTMRLTVGE